MRRMAALVEDNGTLDVEQVMAMQRDVYVGSSATLNRVLVRKMRRPASQPRLMAMRAGCSNSWPPGTANGPMRRDRSPSSCSASIPEFYGPRLGESDIAAFASIGRIKEIMVEDLERQTPEGSHRRSAGASTVRRRRSASLRPGATCTVCRCATRSPSCR